MDFIYSIAAEAKNVIDNVGFATGLNFYKLFWIFFIACFLGVVLETIFVFVTTKKLMNRTGLVMGPFNLVYGIGAVLMTLVLYPLRNSREIFIFLGGALLGGAYEYMCSWAQEKLFGTVSWDYSQMRFNLNGRINLLYCFFWGILGSFWVHDIYPMLSRWIETYIPNDIGIPLTWLLFIFMMVNTILSTLSVARMSLRQKGMSAVTSTGRFWINIIPMRNLQKYTQAWSRWRKNREKTKNICKDKKYVHYYRNLCYCKLYFRFFYKHLLKY